MKQDTLNTAIRLGQLLTLLNPLALGSKFVNKRLARVRSTLHEQVILATLCPDEPAGRRAELRLTEMHDAQLAAVLRLFDVKELLNRSHAERAVYPMQVAKKDATGRVLYRDCEVALFADGPSIPKASVPGVSIAQSQRAQVTRAFTSAVRNTPWLATLMRLETGLTLATDENKRLVAKHSSHPGRVKLADNLLRLCPTYATPVPAKGKRAKKVVVKAEGLYALQVCFSVETLLAQADIGSLAAATLPSGQEPAGHALADLLAAATQPVSVAGGDGVAAGDAAQAVLDKLVAGLTERKKVIDAAASKAKVAADEAAKGEAVQALQQLSPKLLKILKANPELLKTL